MVKIMSYFKWSCIGIVALFLLGGLIHLLGTAGQVASTPTRVLNKTLETNNVIQSYEWFHDVNGQIQSRIGQIKGQKTLIGQDPAVRMELTAMQQSCRDLVTKYNANSSKANKAPFKDNGLPEKFDISICE